jgi:16S rRNA (cytosine967-C5)-methyltransferase
MLGALAVEHGAQVTAIEIAPHRAALVATATKSLPVTVLTVDGRESGLPAASFDRVLVDAPCTGLGALRRRPEARWRRQPGDIPELVKLQRELLFSAIELTRPGGIIVYSTCSPHLAETVGVVSDAVRRHPVTAEDARAVFPGVDGLGSSDAVQLWPHRHGTDAMFTALLRKHA